MSYLTKKNIADMYPLSPMQQGMLFHTLYDPKTSAYFEQFSCTIDGPLDIAGFKAAWNYLIERYPIFRTVFNWKDANKPFQVVLKKRPIDVVVHDLKNMEETTQQRKIDDFLVADKKASFDLATGPLMRFNIIQLAPEKIFFLWSYHHILLDGWCLSLIMEDFFHAYTALKNKSPLPNLSRPLYKTYISWLNKQDKDATKAFWTGYLKDFHTPTPLPRDRQAGDALDNREMEITLSAEDTRQLEGFARERRTTLSTVVQAAWALLLKAYSGQNDVIYGMTVSGRPPGLKGAEAIVGLFINTLPVRAVIDEAATFSEFLSAFNESSADVMAYEWSFLPEIKACSAVSPDSNLFDSIIVFENYPLDPAGFSVESELTVSGFKAREATNYDIAIVMIPGDTLTLRFLYNAARYDKESVSRIMGHLANLIRRIPENGDNTVGTLEFMDEKEKEKILVAFNDTAAGFPATDARTSCSRNRWKRRPITRPCVLKRPH